MKVIVIGGVAAGMSAASQAKKRAGSDSQVIVFERGGDVSYGACGMPYNIADPRRDPGDLVVMKADTFRQKRGLDVRLHHEVTHITPKDHSVSIIDHGSGHSWDESYDSLVIATGARAWTPSVPGTDLPGVYTLHTLEDTRRIKAALADGAKSAVLVGGGYIGLEMAEALRERGLEVTITKRRPQLLPWAAQEFHQRLHDEIQRQGVVLRLGAPLAGIEKSSQGLTVTTEEHELHGDMVLLATGAVPNNQLAVKAGLALGADEAIAVDEQLRTSAEDIWAAGDCADAFHCVSGERVWMPLALRANRAGRIAGANAVGAAQTAPAIAGTIVFKLFDLQMAATGLTLAAAREAGFDAVEDTTTTRSVAHAYPGNSPMQVTLVADRKSGRLLGGQLLSAWGAAHRIDTLAAVIHGKMTVSQLEAMDLAYSPPFGPAWDPLLIASRLLMRKL